MSGKPAFFSDVPWLLSVIGLGLDQVGSLGRRHLNSDARRLIVSVALAEPCPRDPYNAILTYYFTYMYLT